MAGAGKLRRNLDLYFHVIEEGKVPLLISSRALEGLNAVLDFAASRIDLQALGVSLELGRTAGGRYLLDFERVLLAHAGETDSPEDAAGEQMLAEPESARASEAVAPHVADI